MKSLLALLIVLFALLQYELWFSPGGMRQMAQLQKQIDVLNKENQRLIQRNQVLEADITDLKNGQETVEMHARNDMGMVKQGETFYQIVQ